MRSRILTVVVALAAVVCTVATIRSLSDRSDATAVRMVSSGSAQAKQRPDRVSVQRASAVRMNEQIVASERDGTSAVSKGPANNVTARSPAMTGERGDSSQHQARTEHPETPSAVSFSASRSVLASCSGTNTCDHELNLLREFETERRDHTWAPVAEDTLSRFTAEDSMYVLRQLQCRASMCAIEVASTAGPHLGLTYQQEKATGLRKHNALFGYERDENGARVTVTLRLYQRK